LAFVGNKKTFVVRNQRIWNRKKMEGFFPEVIRISIFAHRAQFRDTIPEYATAIAIRVLPAGIEPSWNGLGAAIAAGFGCAASKDARKEIACRATVHYKAEDG
jgi:hypothetical protein